MINKSHYVTMVPTWLAEQLALIGEDLKIVDDFYQLSAIVSVSEVSYYYLTILKLREYHADTFDDMYLVSEKPNNLKWVSEHSDVIKTAKLVFDKAFMKHKGNLHAEDTDVLVKRTSYRPKAIRADTLALVGFESDVEYPLSKFLRDCCTELNKQILFDQYGAMEVFKQYTRHA